MHGVVGWEILVLLPIIMTPAGLYAIADARAYMRSVHTLQEQLASFSLRNSRCSCCDWNHVRNGTPVPCDRDAIGHCIGEWFGTEAEFEHAIHSVVLPAFTSRFGEHLVPFRIFLVATVPLFWGMMDLVAGYAISERGREEGGVIARLGSSFSPCLYRCASFFLSTSQLCLLLAGPLIWPRNR